MHNSAYFLGIIRRNKQENHYDVKTKLLSIITFTLVNDSKNINLDKKMELLSIIDKLDNFDELYKDEKDDFLTEKKINKLKKELKEEQENRKE